MYPVLFHIGPFPLHTYMVMLAVAFGTAIAWGNRQLRQADVAPMREWVDMEVVLVLSSLAGARLLYVATDWETYRDAPLDILKIQEGGAVFYGGLLGAVVGCTAFILYRRLPLAILADIAFPCVALGQFFGRLGCLSAGCCYGKACSLAWAVSFPATAGDSLGRHPTQAYEAAALLVLFLCLELYRRRPGRARGMVPVAYGYGYGAIRFVIEGLRDDFRGPSLLLGLSVSQAISLGIVLLAACLHAVLARRTVRSSG